MGPAGPGLGGGGWAGRVREAKVRSEAGPRAKWGQIWEGSEEVVGHGIHIWRDGVAWGRWEKVSV